MCLQNRLFNNFATTALKLPSFGHTPQPYTGPSYDSVLADKQKYMPSAYFHYYKKPLMFVEGKYQYLYDHKGNRYLDLFSGISTVNVGHSHPRIVDAIKRQAEKLMHTSTLYIGPNQVEYSKMLSQELGQQYNSIMLTNSGGQSNDLAIVLARLASKNQTILSVRNGYHGLVGYTRQVTNVPKWVIRSDAPNFKKLMCPRPIHTTMTVEEMLKDFDELIDFQTDGRLAGVIFQPIQGVGGINELPKEYIEGIIKRVKQHGGYVICDEVQTGFGRIGDDFWGFKWRGIQPDIITMAKGIGNGMPLGALATNQNITKHYQSLYFNTFGGGHLQCSVGIEVLNILRQEKLHNNAENLGKILIQELNNLKSKYKIIGSVRGKGLMIGIELVKGTSPAIAETLQFLEQSRERGILFGKGGLGNVIRIQPPLCITEADVRYTIAALQDFLGELK